MTLSVTKIAMSCISLILHSPSDKKHAISAHKAASRRRLRLHTPPRLSKSPYDFLAVSTINVAMMCVHFIPSIMCVCFKYALYDVCVRASTGTGRGCI